MHRDSRTDQRALQRECVWLVRELGTTEECVIPKLFCSVCLRFCPLLCVFPTPENGSTLAGSRAAAAPWAPAASCSAPPGRESDTCWRPSCCRKEQKQYEMTQFSPIRVLYFLFVIYCLVLLMLFFVFALQFMAVMLEMFPVGLIKKYLLSSWDTTFAITFYLTI